MVSNFVFVYDFHLLCSCLQRGLECGVGGDGGEIAGGEEKSKSGSEYFIIYYYIYLLNK